MVSIGCQGDLKLKYLNSIYCTLKWVLKLMFKNYDVTIWNEDVKQTQNSGGKSGGM